MNYKIVLNVKIENDTEGINVLTWLTANYTNEEILSAWMDSGKGLCQFTILKPDLSNATIALSAVKTQFGSTIKDCNLSLS